MSDSSQAGKEKDRTGNRDMSVHKGVIRQVERGGLKDCESEDKAVQFKP